MKEYWKMLKRGLAMALAVVMLLTSSNLGVVLRAAATGTDDGPKKELADIVVELYADALSENLIEIIKSGELAVEKTYTYDQPTKSELITIDEEKHTITAESYEDESGNVWTPVRYRLIADGTTQKVGTMEAGVPVLYTYEGNAFSVEVDYEATLELDEKQQNELLTSASKLAEDIAKLMLTGENIIPDLKPEGWDNWSEQRQKAYKDYDLIVKYEGLQNYVNDMLEKMEMSNVTLTPQMVAMFMTMPVLAYDGESDLSAIDLMAKLGSGDIKVEVPLPDELLKVLDEDELNSELVNGKINVAPKFGKDIRKNIIPSLLAQQEAGGLDLQKFLESNAGNSYLEWLMVPANYEALVSALTGNYDEIYTLIDPNEEGLKYVLHTMEKLLEDVEYIEGVALDMISDMLPELNQTLKNNGFAPFGKDVVENKADVDALVEHIKKVQVNAQGKLDNALTLLNTELKTYGYTKEVKTAADLEKALDWLDEEVAKAKAAKKAAVENANTIMAGFGYSETIADIADIDVAIEWLTNEAQGDLLDAQNEVKAKLNAANALAQGFGYTGTISSAADVDKVMTWLEDQIKKDQTTLDGYLKTANDALAQANAELPEEAEKYTGVVEGSWDIPAVKTWMTGLVADAEQLKRDELDKLNNALKDYGYTGDPVEEANDIAGVVAYLDDMLSKAETARENGYNALNTELAKYDYPNEVDSPDDISTVITWLEEQVETAEGELKKAFESINKTLVNDYGYSGDPVEKSEDMQNVINWYTTAYEQEKADAQTAIENTLNNLNGVLNNYGYAGEIAGSSDMDAAIAYMSNDAAAYIWGKVNTNMPAGVSVNSVDDVTTAKDALLLAKTMGTITEEVYNTAVAGLDGAVALVNEIPTIVESMTKAKNNLAAYETLLAEGEAEFEKSVKTLTGIQDTLDTAEANVAELRTNAEAAITMLEEKHGELVEGEKTLNTLRNQVKEAKTMLLLAKEQLANAEQKIADADTMVKEYTATLESAESAMRNLEEKIASKKAALPEQKAKLTAAQTDLKAAEDALANLDNPYAQKIAKLRPLQGDISDADLRVDEIDVQKKSLNGWLKTIITVEDALTELNSGLEKMAEVQKALGEVEENKATLVETIDMLDILITMLELFCQKIEPIYTSAKADNWNVRSVLKPYSAAANYDKLTELATGETAPEVKIETSYKLPEATVSNNLAMWNVNVVVKGYYIGENNERVDLDDFVAGTVALIDGATQEQIVAAVEELNAEEAAEAFWNNLVNSENSSVWQDANLPETLTEDITYVIEYIPQMWEMTYGEGFEGDHGLSNNYAHGWNLVLPVHEDENLEWEYTVNGEKFRQGETIKITGETTISRKEGAASEKVALTQLVIDTTAGMSQTAKNILNSQALKLKDVVYIRLPGEDLVVVSRVDGQTVVTAPNYDSNVAGDWVANTGIMDEETVYFENGEFVTDKVFKEIIVKYYLGVSAAELGVSSDKLNDYVNAGYVLASDYNFQKETLDNLIWALSTNDRESGETANLEGLSMLDRGYNIEMSGLKLSLGSALGAPDSNAEMIGGMFELSPEAIAALANVLKELNRILPSSGPHPLYNTLKAYAESSNGMLHFYQNEQTYIDQLNELNAIMGTLPMDELAALPAAFYDLFNTIKVALGNAAALGNAENRIRTDLIDLKSGYLNALLNELAKYDLNEQYSVSGDLNWYVDIAAAGPDSVKYSVTVNVAGVGSYKESFTKNMDEGFDAAAEAAAMLEAKGWEIDDRYYDEEVTSSGNDYVFNYTYKNFYVEIPGSEPAVLNLNNQTIILPGHSNPAFAYDYNVAGEVVRVFGDDFAKTLSPAQFDALTIGGVKITVEEVNVAEDKLVELVEGTMGGTLVKNEEGKYAAVLGIDVGNTNNLIGMVMGLYMSGYETVELGGKTLVANGQFHLQTLIDALLYSGISTMDLNKNIAADGTITNTLVIGGKQRAISTTVEGNHYTLIQSTLTFGDQEPIDVYFTLTGNGAAFKNILNTISGYGVDVQLNNGSANLTITIPEPFYTAYLAALSMVGEVDIRNMDAVNAEVAVGYVTKMITDILNTEGVSIETFGNMIGKDLSGYESYYDMAKDLMNMVKFVDDCTIVLDLPVIPIKGIIDRLEGSIQLPIEGVTLGGLIAEYETGLDVAVGAKINNFANDYDVLFVDVKANGLSNKVGMTNLGEGGKLDLQTTSVVVLLHDIEGDLYIPDTLTLVDLNGFDVTGTIKGGASADVLVIDSNYVAAEGVVGGVEGNVTVLAGKYNSDVSAFVNDGYMQDDNGVVCNKLFTISETDNVITVTLNTTVADAKTLLTQEGVFGLAAEILFDQFINHYNVAGVSMDGNTIYNINFEDILGIVTGGADAIVDTALGFIDASELSEVFNLLVKDLTDFKAMGAALSDEGTGVIASHEFTTTTWGLNVAHESESDTLTINFGGNYGKTETKTLQLEIEGQARGAMATLATALGDVLTVDLRVELEDIYRNDAGQFNLKGDVFGTVVFDFTHNPNYAIMISAILAENADEALRADLVAGIESFYATGSMNKLHEIFNAMSIEDVCNSWDEHIGVDSFVEIVDSLELKDTTKASIKAVIDDSEMGFDLLIDGIAAGLRLLNEHGIGESVTDSGRTLGSLELEDADGSYYGRVGSFEIAGTNRLMDYRLTAASVGAKIYLFSDDELPIDDPTIEIDADKIKLGDKLYGVKYDEDKGYLILDVKVDNKGCCLTLDEVLAVLNQGAEMENNINRLPIFVPDDSKIVGDNGLVGTGSTITLRAMNSVNETDEVTVTIVILGDVDCNGKLNANDAVQMRFFALYKEGYELNEIQKVAANANGLASNFSREGVDSGDAVIVKLKWLGKYGTVLPEYVSPLN